jgi:hypothetical protein
VTVQYRDRAPGERCILPPPPLQPAGLSMRDTENYVVTSVVRLLVAQAHDAFDKRDEVLHREALSALAKLASSSKYLRP